MSTYLGNPSLSAAVKDRVMSTFDQSVALYKQGRIEEVVAGCGLILQMDPQFDPAKRLLEKARNPMLPIDVDTLVPASAADALNEARAALRQRDFQRVINITTEVLTNDLMNDDARLLGDEARERMEAAPFVEQFARKFEQNLAAGDSAAARATLEKARALDPDHPAVKDMDEKVSGRSGAAAPPPPASSFVVEAPAAVPGRAAAQAADFGFTFEEEHAEPKPAAPEPPPPPPAANAFSFDAPPSNSFSFENFSFDSPAPAAGNQFDFGGGAAKAPASGEFDFSGGSFETSPEDRKRIEQYLADGDRAFSSGDYQQAIDLWSRIFLIDVTNEQASERIESAKGKRREIETKADSIVASATQALDRGDVAAARTQFENVLAIDPQNLTARDYLARIIASTAPPPVAAAAPATAPAPIPPPPPETRYDVLTDDEVSGSYSSDSSDSSYSSGSITPPSPTAEKKKAAPAAKAATKKSLPIGAIAGVVGVLLVAVVGWYAYTKLFQKPAYDPAAAKAIFTRANDLAQHGKFDLAIAALQDVKPDDPQHDRAVTMIADLQHRKTQSAEMIDGKPASAFFDEQVSAANAAFAAHDYDGAKKAFEQAMRVRPLAPEARTLYDSASQQVAKLDTAKSMFRERKFQDALTGLQSLQQQDPENKNIQRMIVDAHFNLGATALQEERLPDAIREFDEVLRLDPGDELAKRSRELAARYNGQPRDLLYKIYVKYLPLRQMA